MAKDNGSANRNPSRLTRREEAVLMAVRDLRFVTVPDIAASCFTLRSLSGARAVLHRLAGGADYVPGAYLYRFPLPSASIGTPARVYCLGARGRRHLGLSGYFRPAALRGHAHSHLMHHLMLARLVCSAKLWCRAQTAPPVSLIATRLCHDLAGEISRQRADGPAPNRQRFVVPDAFLNFAFDEAGLDCQPILIELDRGSEFKRRFLAHVSERLDFIVQGHYRAVFGTDAVRIAYVTAGAGAQAQLASRLRAMRVWTLEALVGRGMAEWESVFYFASARYETLYSLSLFTDPVWVTAGDETPRNLLDL